MKQILKTSLCLMLALAMLLAAAPCALAGASGRVSGLIGQAEGPALSAREDEAELLAAQRMFEGMSLEELNRYIDAGIMSLERSGALSSTGEAAGQDRIAIHYTAQQLKKLWLAAAQAARKVGYPCSATLIECAVKGVDYRETQGKGGLFRDQIVTTNVFKTFMSKIKLGSCRLGKSYVLSHPKSENRDLYYSLHACTYKTTRDCLRYNITVTDTYDFALMDYGSLFTGVVNNWAWLCQHAGVLQKIQVKITFTA